MSFAGTSMKLETIMLTENQTLHVLTHKWVFNNENTCTQGGKYHTLGSVGETRGGTGGREVGEE